MYPVSLHIIRQSDGTGGIPFEVCDSLIASVNDLLEPAGIGIFLCEEVEYIDSDYYYDYNKIQENGLYQQHYVANTLNLYIPNTVSTPSGSPQCGYTYYPGWKDMAFVASVCALDGSTLAHEVGHYFGLYHTHGVSNTQMTDEFADFSNCLVAGDDVCDTPAEPNLSTGVDSSCIYQGTASDANGFPFDPDPSNIMSYAPKPCKFQFTQGQYNRMSYVATYLRDYLACPAISADFIIAESGSMCASEQTIDLGAAGVGANQWFWDIDGDGIYEYSGNQVSHTFTEPGMYTVCATAIGAAGEVTKCEPFAFSMSEQLVAPVTLHFNEFVGKVTNPDHNYGWTHQTITPSNPNGVLFIDNFHYNNLGEQDDYYIGPVITSDLDVPVLEFKRAYAPYSAQKLDALQISVSSDCGASFTEVAFYDGLELSTVTDFHPYDWMPSFDDDWSTDVINLGGMGSDTLIIRFRNITNSGNNLYLDKIKVIDQLVLSLDLLRFEAYSDKNGQHTVVWETAREMDVAEYVVQHSIDGQQFTSIGSVTPKNDLHNMYKFTTNAISPISFYRLLMKEQDGSVDFSPIRSLKNSGTTLQVYPNPASSAVTIHTAGDNVLQAENLELYSQTGKVIDGVSIIDQSASNGTLRVDISNLIPGIYTFRSGSVTGRFLKVGN